MFYHSQLSKGNQVKMLYFHAAATAVFKGIDSITEDTEGNNLDDGSVPAGNSVYVNGNASITLQVTDISEETTVTIANRWTTPVTVTYKGTDYTLAAGATQALTVAVDDIITVAEGTAGSTFREWRNSTIPFVKGAACRITAMPAMDAFTTTAAGTTAGNYFFYFFNNNGSLTSLPDGSFKTENITSVGIYFFYYFNSGETQLSSLPEGSFQLATGLAEAKNYFFAYFNNGGSLTSLPVGSFNTSKITVVGNNFFNAFDSGGSLTLLASSFALPTELTRVGTNYCTNMFNASQLTKGNEAKELYFYAAATGAFKGITSIEADTDGNVLAGGTVQAGKSVRVKGECFAGGAGSEDDPYRITNAEELNNVRNFLGKPHNDKHFKVMNYIDLTDYLAAKGGTEGWEPIGDNTTTSFQGKFHGSGHKVTGLWINGTADYVGLFGYTNSATIDSLGVEIAATGVSGYYYVGGLVGYQNSSSITSCYASGSVSGTGVDVGGLVGYKKGSITSSYATGSVRGTDFVGGLVGGQQSGSITTSYFDKETTGKTQGVGSANASLTSEVTAYTTAEMMAQDSLVGLDFTTPMFKIIDGGSYPYLVYQAAPVVSKIIQNLAKITIPTGGLDSVQTFVQENGSYTLLDGFVANVTAGNKEIDITARNLSVGDTLVFISHKEDETAGIWAPSYPVRTHVLSLDTTLSSLTVDNGTLSPTFAATTFAYTDTVGYAVDSIRITAITTHAKATIAEDYSEKQVLAVGENTFTFNVTAEDTDSTAIYTLSVLRHDTVAVEDLEYSLTSVT